MDQHPHGKWESGIGTSYHQILQACCVPPYSATTTAAHSTPINSNYAGFGLAPCRRTPPFPLLKSCDLECSNSCDVFNIFNFSTCRPATFVSHHSIHLIGHQSMLVASNALSDPPRPLFTSILHSRCCIPCCRQIWTCGEEILT